jgi:hypothetical protein
MTGYGDPFRASHSMLITGREPEKIFDRELVCLSSLIVAMISPEFYISEDLNW